MINSKDDYFRMTGKKYRFGIYSFIIWLFQPQIRYMFWWRKYNKTKSAVYRLILLRYTHKYGLEISSEAKIGRGLYLGHPYNITVGSDVVIGNNVNLHKGCTIGRENRGNREGSPTLGNNIYVGVNSTIVGRIVIGDDVLIAPNSYVNINVPAHSIVIGNPAVIHSCKNATYSYINFVV